MSEQKTKEVRESIIAMLKDESPLSLTEISERLNMSKPTVLTYVRLLIEEDVIISISSARNRKVYYALNREATIEDVNKMHIEIAKETVDAKDIYEELKLQYDVVNANVNGIYVNIISMMSIFVAIFSLITVNANIVFKLTTENMPDVFWGIIKINGFVVICIIVLLIGVRKIIIDPMLKKGKKEQ